MRLNYENGDYHSMSYQYSTWGRTKAVDSMPFFQVEFWAYAAKSQVLCYSRLSKNWMPRWDLIYKELLGKYLYEKK